MFSETIRFGEQDPKARQQSLPRNRKLLSLKTIPDDANSK